MIKTESSLLTFEDCVLIGENIYFVEYHIAALFSMNLHTGEVNYIDRLPDEVIVQVHLVSKILHYKNELILIPARTENYFIWFYDLAEGSWERVPFEDRGVRAPYEQFEYATIYNGELFLVGGCYPALICMDLESRRLKYYEIFENSLQMHSVGGCESIGTQMYIPSPVRNQVTVFDMQLKQCRCFTVGNEKNAYSGIRKNGESFWLSPMDKPVFVKWDGGDGVMEYDLPEEFQHESGCIFNGIAFCQGRICLYGLRDKFSFCFLPNNGETYEIIENSYLMYKKIDDNQFITCDYSGKIQMISGKVKKEFMYAFSEIEMGQIMKTWKQELAETKNRKLQEDEFVRLGRFLSVL